MSRIRRLRLDRAEERPLEGAHLALDLRARLEGRAPSRYVYAGFLSSLDGRIGFADSSGPPPAVANDRDWRLFNELIMQADVVLSSGRYVRDVASGKAQQLLPDPEGDFGDLHEWREARGLAPRPAVAIVTREADFDPEEAAALAEDVIVLAGSPLGDERARALERAGVEIETVAGESRPEREAQSPGTSEERVSGDTALEALSMRGLRLVCCAAGPEVLRTIAPHLDALFLTIATRLVGGRTPATMLAGDRLDPAISFEVASVLLDPEAPESANQLLLELVRTD